MKCRKITFPLAAGFLLLISSPSFSQSKASSAAPDTLLEVQEVDLETAKRAYHKKVMDRAKAKAEAKEAKAAAKEAKYQVEEALEAAKAAEKLARLEERVQRRQERRESRKAKPKEVSAK